MSVVELERWLDEAELVDHFAGAFRSRWLRYRRAEGLPHWRVGGKVRYRLSEVVAWLEEHGHVERREQ